MIVIFTSIVVSLTIIVATSAYVEIALGAELQHGNTSRKIPGQLLEALTGAYRGAVSKAD